MSRRHAKELQNVEQRSAPHSRSGTWSGPRVAPGFSSPAFARAPQPGASVQSKIFQTEKLAALGQLVSGIAHELNNPLTSIMGYAQLLLGRGLADKPMAEAKKIFQEAERARRIVKNLLFFARETTPERSPVDLNEVVERTLALRSYELKIENIAIETDLSPDLPRTMADPYQLQQVVLNLLVNAEQALMESRGHGTVRISTGYAGADRLALEVADDGPGMPTAIASRIFEPFFTTKPPGVGTGLGLSIVYGIVHQHGGEISLESRPGAGTKIRVELPLTAAPGARLQPVASAPEITELKVRPSRILVVEDEPTVGQLIADVLREDGHHVDAAQDGQEGLARLSTASYHLVICDLRMARLDGQAFYDALARANPNLRERIIFITGDVLSSRTVEFLEPNGLPFLAKPFLVEELKLAVNHALQSHARRDSSPPGNSR
jgi:two-component system, NtrC family, sensor kinase